jgi:hypothetical protein
LFRARQATRIRKRKVALQNRKKREERLRKFPPKIPAKVVLMLKAKGIWGKAKTLRYLLIMGWGKLYILLYSVTIMQTDALF